MENRDLTYSERWFLAYGETFDEWCEENEKKGVYHIPGCDLADRWTEHGIPKTTKELRETKWKIN